MKVSVIEGSHSPSLNSKKQSLKTFFVFKLSFVPSPQTKICTIKQRIRRCMCILIQACPINLSEIFMQIFYITLRCKWGQKWPFKFLKIFILYIFRILRLKGKSSKKNHTLKKAKQA